MIASNIGRIFLEAYNEKFKCNYDAKSFFIDVYYELFYNHNKYMMSAGNSPLENPKISWDKMRAGLIPYEINERRTERFAKTIYKIENEPADASIAIGFPSLDTNATTSGQITNMDLPISNDDVYLSWIGSGLGVGVQGGLSILFNNKEILLDIFEGWVIYRNLLNNTKNLRGNQINTWNGNWLAHRYNKLTFDPDNPTASFDPLSTKPDGVIEIQSIPWTRVLVGIARVQSKNKITTYVYSLGQMNITIGFILFDLPRIIQPFELYQKYFGTTKKERVEQLFGTAFGFSTACQMGAIGVNAMEPKGFRECMIRGVLPKYDFNDEEKELNFKTYQIWLLSMLNNEQLWEKTQIIAKSLNEYSSSDTNAKKVKSQEVTNLLSSLNKKQFVEYLTVIVKTCTEPQKFAEIAELLHNLPADNVPYFLTLLRFQYAIINKK